jgi:Staphylococcal nuclease homologue
VSGFSRTRSGAAAGSATQSRPRTRTSEPADHSSRPRIVVWAGELPGPAANSQWLITAVKHHVHGWPAGARRIRTVSGAMLRRLYDRVRSGWGGTEPEGPRGGAQATSAMRAMVLGRELRCELDGERTHDRCVGICYLEGQDISEVMVRRGLARDWPGSAVGVCRAERRPCCRQCHESSGRRRPCPEWARLSGRALCCSPSG